MTDIAMFPGERGSGKTTLILEQARQSLYVGQSVAIITATASLQDRLYRLMVEWDEGHRPVPVFTESTIQSSRGYRFDHIFIDDAEKFQDSSIDMVEHYHPGVPLTITYTPPWRSSLPDEKPLTPSPKGRTLGI